MMSVLAVAISAAALNFATVRNGCHDVAMWQGVNVPVAPAVASTEVSRGTGLFDASHFLGMLLTLRNGRVYFSGPAAMTAGPDNPSAASRELLAQLGISGRNTMARGTVTPVAATRALTKKYIAIDCFSAR